MRTFLLSLLGLLLILAIVVVYGLNRIGPTASGYAAKITCSCTFLADREYQQIYQEELGARSYITTTIDRENRSVTATTLGMFERTAIYREGLGCTLVHETTPEALREQVELNALAAPVDSMKLKPWPLGDSMGSIQPPEGVDAAALNEALDWAFAEHDPESPKRTRAVLVVYKDQLIAERYAEGFGPETRQMGWSMTKSITQALTGILVGQGNLDIHQPAPVEAWQTEGDPRAAITLDQLLRMSSGLEFDEEYSILGSDATRMLFQQPSASGYAIDKPLAHAPDSEWYYSSGTSNIVQHIIRRQFDTPLSYLNFPREALFNKIGMHSALIEPDANGTFVGSSFCYATARDWARFGLLYLHDGVWQGERILPEGWVTYTRTPTPKAPNGRYGAHFWLNAGEDSQGTNRRFPQLPADHYYCSGYEFQRVAIFPSNDLVVVRLGVKASAAPEAEDAYHEELFMRILKAF